MVTATAGKVGKDVGRCVACGSEVDALSLPLAAANDADADRLRDPFLDAGAASVPHVGSARGPESPTRQVYVVACRDHLKVLAELHHYVHETGELLPDHVRATLAPHEPLAPRGVG